MECTEFRELTGCQQRRWSGTAVCVMRSCPWEGNAQTISWSASWMMRKRLSGGS